MLCFDFFFLPPIHSFAIDDREHWISLAAFLITASTVGHLSIRAKQRAAEAEASAEEVRDLYNHAPCGYHSLDKESVFVRINDTECEWLGYTREELVGKLKFADLLTAEGAEPSREFSLDSKKKERFTISSSNWSGKMAPSCRSFSAPRPSGISTEIT